MLAWNHFMHSKSGRESPTTTATNILEKAKLESPTSPTNMPPSNMVAMNGNAVPSTPQTNGIKAEKPYERRSSNARAPPMKLPSGTFDAQTELPRLPIPSLDETLIKFPQLIKALQTEEEHKETLKIIEEFRTGDGPKLQQLLLDYEEEGKRTGSFGSYVEEFWNDSYLAPDSSVVLNLNPYFILEKGPDRKIANNQLYRAASLCFASLKMASMLKHETLPPDRFKGRPLCMDQFKVLFGTTRVPGASEKDHVHHYPDSTHVVVLIKNRIYYFQALWPHDGSVAVDQHDIKDILEAIQKHAEHVSQFPSKGNESNNKAGADLNIDGVAINSCDEALGVLTSLPRREWASARKMIMEGDDENNIKALQIIDSALFVLVLDDHTPKNIKEAACNMLHGSHKLVKGPNNTLVQAGSCCNRWYDKLQLIVMKNGKAGVNFEHSAIDGHTALRYVSDIFAENIVQFAQSITALIYGQGWIPDNMQAVVNRSSTSMSETCNRDHHDGDEDPILDVFPKRLEFNLPHKVKELIRYAETNLGDQINSSDTEVLEFTSYGKTMIVKNSLSPDSFVQMSIMMAYHKLYGKFVCSYEPVLTKAFYHGRTEAMRGATPQAKKLCELWCNEKATKAEQLEALRVATKEHSRLVRECANGKGVDRHLFALKSIAAKNNVKLPAFFKSAGWEALNHTVISTSNCGNPSLRLFGFGPVVQDGFGIGYIIRDTGIHFAVASKHRQTLRFVNELENTLMALKRLLNATSTVVCHGQHHHHNHVIHPPQEVTDALENDDYGDFWGENSVLHTAPPAMSHFEPQSPIRQRSNSIVEAEHVFANVVRKDSFRIADIRTIGLNLSFDEGVESDASVSSVDGNWYYGSTHHRRSDSDSDPHDSD